MIIASLIVAAGQGRRAGGAIPKQWQMLGDAPVIAHTMRAFDRSDLTCVVIAADMMDHWAETGLKADLVVPGGATRDASVRAGLEALELHAPDLVLIHDAARPLVSAGLIDRVIKALDTSPGAAPALAVTDALWTGQNAQVTGTQDREGLFRAQTPQGFHFDQILAAHRSQTGPFADDVAVARAAGLDVAIVEGDADNMKITGPDDLHRAAQKLDKTSMDIRLGNGYDVHRFGPGDGVWLCGVKIPHNKALQGHSDADVGMHAVTDAIYGALGQGDIGQHFPPSDPQWKGAESHIFLRHAVELAGTMGFRVGNVDCTLVCEYPKVGPHQPAMRARMAEIMNLKADRISVKATTSERLGFTGREEGIAAIATATLIST